MSACAVPSASVPRSRERLGRAGAGGGEISAATTRFEIYTESGSVYSVARESDGWWVEAINVPNPSSAPLEASGRWPIAPPQPWPPVLGLPLRLMAAQELPVDDPRRLPGGGKETSAVRHVLRISGERPA